MTDALTAAKDDLLCRPSFPSQYITFTGISLVADHMTATELKFVVVHAHTILCTFVLILPLISLDVLLIYHLSQRKDENH